MKNDYRKYVVSCLFISVSRFIFLDFKDETGD
jgi:hypothetical protein